MADKFIEHGKYPAYAAIPGWGLCQDGDGAANGLAVSALASITFNGFDNTAGNVSIMGVAVAFAYGTSAAAQATSLAAAINASTGAVNAGTTPNATQLRDLVYAKATAGVVEIMTRAGSATLNHAANSNVAITHSLNGTAPTIVQLAGGVSGSWGYFFNTTTMWPSAKAILAYSFLLTKPLIGDASGGDTVYVRTALNGNPLYLTALFTGNPPQFRTFGIGVIKFIYNSGNAWPETNGRLTVRLQHANGLSYQANVLNTVAQVEGAFKHHVGGSCSDDGEPNFGFELAAIGYSNSLAFHFFGARDRAEMCFFATGSRTSNDALYTYSNPIGVSGSQAEGTTHNPTLERCLIIIKQGNNGSIGAGENTAALGFNLIQCTVRGIGVSNITNGLFAQSAYFWTPTTLLIKGLKLEGIPPNTALIATNAYIDISKVIVEDTDMTNLEATQGRMVDSASFDALKAGLSVSSTTGGFPFIIENTRHSIYWLPTKGIPTLNATTPDNYKMSWAMQISTSVSSTGRNNPVYFPKMGYLDQGADGIRTFTINLLADKEKTLTTDDVYMLVSYIDAATGALKVASTRARVAVALVPVANMTPDWSQVKNDGSGSILPYMTIGADRFYKRYQLVLTTPTSVKQNTSVALQVAIESPSTSASDRFIVCPEVLSA